MIDYLRSTLSGERRGSMSEQAAPVRIKVVGVGGRRLQRHPQDVEASAPRTSPSWRSTPTCSPWSRSRVCPRSP